MNNRTVAALLCVLLLVAPAATAQQTMSLNFPDPEEQFRGPGNWLTRNYVPVEIPPINLANSPRLEELIRAGYLYLSLQDAIALALENNLDIELQRYGPQIAQASLLRAKAGGLLRGVPPTIQRGPDSVQSQVIGGATGGAGGAQFRGAAAGGGDTGGTIITATGTAFQNLDPVFVANYNAGHRTRPQSNTITTGTTALTFDSHSWNYGVTKGFLTGTSVSFGWNSDWFMSNNIRSDINPSYSSNFQLQITQRLLQGFGRAVNNRNIVVAKNNVKVSDLQFKLQVITTVAAIVNLYWDLVAFNEDLKVKQQALALAQKLYEDNKKQVEIGTLAPIEIVSAEAQVARRQQELTQAETALLQQETVIKNALSRTGVASPTIMNARIVPTDRIQIPDVEPVMPIQDLIDTALRKRPDLEQARIQIDNAQIGLKGTKSQMLPSLDVSATFANNALTGSVNTLGQNLADPIGPRNVDPFFLGGFGNALAQLFRRNFPDYAIGFSLNIPILNRSARADMAIDMLNIRQAELNLQRQINQLRVDVENAVIAIKNARARYEAARKERVLQEQTLDAEQKKYALGASTVFFVIQYQRDLAQAQSNEVAALAQYAKAHVELERILGETLDRYNINIQEAFAGKVSAPPAPLPQQVPQQP